jgi:thiol-disulfide isomerase/thioredoxin
MRFVRTGLFFAMALTALRAAPSSLLGQKPPAWDQLVWLQGEPLPLAKLQGKVVLIRWWTAPGCPYCRATAPALNEFYRTYRDRGLEVIGVYHHKANDAWSAEVVSAQARRLGFEFPIAIDPEWRTLRRWWLDRSEEQWTSVSFLLDRQGIVRHIHPGGQYVKGDADYAVMQAKIEELLAEK